MKKNKLLLLSIFILSILFISSCNKQDTKTSSDDVKNQENVPVATSKADVSNEVKNDIEPDEKEGPWSKFTAQDLDEKEYNQDILKDKKLTVVNIWGTFWGPCLRELPYLAEISEEYKDKDVQFVGIVIDTLDQNGEYSKDQINVAKDIISKSNVKYLNLLPSSDLINIYLKNVQAIPETLILDSKGNILQSFLGAREKDEFKKIIDEELVKLK